MKVWEFLAERRKAIVAFIIGQLQVYLLYLQLLATHAQLTNGDLQLLVSAEIVALGGTVLVHQAINNAKGE